MKYLILTSLVAFLWVSTAVAQTPPPTSAPAEQAEASTPQVQTLQAEIIDITGTVMKTTTPEKADSWVPATVGDKLGRYSWILTGVDSTCVLKFADRGEVTIKSITKAGIGNFAKRDDTVQAEVGVKYGAVHADVDSSKGKNDFRVRAGSDVVALRGSDVGVATSELGSGFQQGTGHGQLTYGNGLSRWLNPGTKQLDGNSTPSDLVNNALATWLGDVTGGLTPSEQQFLNDYFTGGNFNNTLGGFGGLGSHTTTPQSLLNQYYNRTVYWIGSGTFTDPNYENGSGGFGAWTGSGTFEYNSLAGSWMGSGQWIGEVGTPTAVPTSFAGSGTWSTGSDTGTFVIAGKGGPPCGAHTVINQNDLTWTGSGPATLVSFTSDSGRVGGGGDGDFLGQGMRVTGP